MTRDRIEQLFMLLPPEAGMFTAGLPLGTPPPGLPERLANALNDPGFGYRFVRDFVKRGESLPPSVHEAWLRRAYDYYVSEGRFNDAIMQEVAILAVDANRYKNRILNALLVSQDISYEKIAETFRVNEQVVRIYEQLHFNVRDRAADITFISRLVFPEGRMQTLKTNGIEALSPESLLLIAGYTNGAEDVLWLAGGKNEKYLPTTEQSLKKFEDALVNNALQLARAGALNSKSAPGIAHGKSLLVAKRNSDQLKDSAPAGQQDISIGDAILLSMPRTKAGAERATAAADARAKGHAEFFAKLGAG